MGSAGYQTGAHVVFKLSVHIVFVTKYRRKAITARVWEVMLDGRQWAEYPEVSNG